VFGTTFLTLIFYLHRSNPSKSDTSQ
jgi:hypothetical protein